MAVILHSDQERRLAWFRQARFGMFIHWGLYSLLGRHEWAMNRERIPVNEYERLADQWQPRPHCMRDWAKLAKRAGMKYMVLTTKHHEGFCLFDTKLTDYNAVKRGPGRDLVAEYVDACRAEDLKVGFYFTLMDWHHPDGVRCLKDVAAWRRFVDYVHGQVRELCSNYGKVDIIWFDANLPLSVDSWLPGDLLSMILSLQPDCIINNRTGLDGDFGTPEQHITPEEGGRMWEACMTFNDSWGYTPIDTNYKSAWEIVSMLRQCAAGGGNLLFNIGPTPDGSLYHPCDTELESVGEWMEEFGTSIYEATDPVRQDWMITGAFTRKGNTLYYHCNRWPGTELAIGGLRCRILSARFMGGSDIEFIQRDDRLILQNLPEVAPDKLATVIELAFDGEAVHELGPGHKLIREV
jgi:alpha-L-fucosidase